MLNLGPVSCGPRLADFCTVRALSAVAAHALGITDLRQRAIFRFREESRGRASQQTQLLTQSHGALLGQRLNQILQHSAQPPRHLDALSSKVADLGNRQLDKILPDRGAIDEPQIAGRVPYPFVVQVPVADVAQEVMNIAPLGRNVLPTWSMR